MLFHPSLSSYNFLSNSFKESDTITMDGRMSIVLLVCVWCSLDAGGLLVVATAEPTVSAVILTPEADRNVGGKLVMNCNATNLQPGSFMEWRRDNKPIKVISSRRFMFTKSSPESGKIVQNFTINHLQSEDYDEYYVCNVNHPIRGGGNTIVATSCVFLSAPSYPACSPSGPKPVYIGTELQLRCISEADNPADIEPYPMTDPSNYNWTRSSVDGKDTLSLNLNVTVADNGVEFNCSANSTPMVLQGSGKDTMTRSCIIGPISVAMSTDATNKITTIQPETTPNPPNHSPWLVAFVVTLSVSTIAIILGAFQIFKKTRLVNSLGKTEASQVPKADPYTKLQPTDHENRGYTEPTTATTTIQEVENVSQDGYLRPRPHDPNEQRRNHQVTVHVDPTPNPEVTTIQHTFNQPVDLENERQERNTSTGYEVVLTQPQHSVRRYQNIYN